MQEHGLTFLQAIKQFSISSLYLGMLLWRLRLQKLL